MAANVKVNAEDVADARTWFVLVIGWGAMVAMAAIIAGVVGFGWDIVSYTARGVRYVLGVRS